MPSRPRGRPPYPDILTPAEWRVVDWLRHGVTRREIARRRRTSIDAVKYHIANITAKLGVASSAELRQWPGYPMATALAARQRSRKEHPMTSTPLHLGPVGQVSLLSRDVGRTETFYRDTLGLPHIFTFGDLTFFDMGGVRLYLRVVGEDEWRPSSTIYFLVEEIHPAFEELRARGVKTIGAPHVIYTDDQTGIEEWMAFFEDPDGNTLAIMSRVSPPS
jgi:DNA-binding CsgD family transcriptional regulator/catechol 2,3-dioxygenase-like lactoylglutathione lyase family enzyme